MLSTEQIKKNQRICFIKFMKKNGLKSNTWAKKAGVAEATIRHYLSGRNSSMTSLSLQLLAQSIKVNIANLIDNYEKRSSN